MRSIVLRPGALRHWRRSPDRDSESAVAKGVSFSSLLLALACPAAREFVLSPDSPSHQNVHALSQQMVQVISILQYVLKGERNS